MRDDQVIVRWAVALVLQVALALGALYVVFTASDASLADILLDPELARRPNIVRQTGPYLRATLAISVCGMIFIPLLLSSTWLLIAWRTGIDGPGQARGHTAKWWALAAIGTILMIGFGALLFWSGVLQRHWDPEWADGFDYFSLPGCVIFMAGMLVYFWVSYYLIGTLFTTPRILAPAVPLATLVRR